MAALDDEAIDALVSSTSWLLVDGELQKVVELPSFSLALSYVMAVGSLAERANHHPNMSIAYDKVTLRLSSHDVGAITERDANLARQIDEIDR